MLIFVEPNCHSPQKATSPSQRFSEDALFLVACFLNTKGDLAAFSVVNKQCFKIAKNDAFWKILLQTSDEQIHQRDLQFLIEMKKLHFTKFAIPSENVREQYIAWKRRHLMALDATVWISYKKYLSYSHSGCCCPCFWMSWYNFLDYLNCLRMPPR